MNPWKLRITVAIGLMALSGPLFAASSHRQIFSRDKSYEEYLHIRANPDEKITPMRVIRWIQGLRGEAVSAPTAMEFQPVVNADNGQFKVVAAMTLKFF